MAEEDFDGDSDCPCCEDSINERDAAIECQMKAEARVDVLRLALEQIRDTCPGRPAILARAALGESRQVSLQPVAWCPTCVPINGRHATGCQS